MAGGALFAADGGIDTWRDSAWVYPALITGTPRLSHAGPFTRAARERFSAMPG